jgi:hypothetical protein
MDPLTVGYGVAMAVISQATRKLMEKAGDPEKIAKGVNWLFRAAAHFFKVRRKQAPADAPIAPPPADDSTPELSDAVTDAVVEEKRAAVEDIAAAIKKPDSAPAAGGVRVKALDDFAAEQIEREIASLLTQIDTYLNNLRFEEEKASQHGGVTFAPVIVMNTIRLQKREIAARLVRLNAAVSKAYGVSAPDLDLLAAALNE